MKIVSLLKRDGGSRIVIDDTEYFFEPNDAGEHTCEVGDEAHIGIFLAIKEGYAEVTSPTKATKK